MLFMKTYFCLAFYTFQKIEDPKAEIKLQLDVLTKLDATSRIYISEEGINGQLSLEENDALKYIEWMHSREQFKDIDFKIHKWYEQAFPRLIVKYRKYLVAREKDVDFSNQGEHVPASLWKKMLEEKKDTLLLDVRNTYEWKVGRFEGAEVPPCETYREFEKYAEELKERTNPKEQKVMMYCTGGIRCEVYSALLKQLGFEKVYQLKGGIIKYGLEEGSKHWKGKLFVFDDRMTVPISEDETEVIGSCHHCGTKTESYYNCANMDCNELFLSCKECLPKFKGCCCTSCMEAPRLRAFAELNPHKPFRRKHLVRQQ